MGTLPYETRENVKDKGVRTPWDEEEEFSDPSNFSSEGPNQNPIPVVRSVSVGTPSRRFSQESLQKKSHKEHEYDIANREQWNNRMMVVKAVVFSGAVLGLGELARLTWNDGLVKQAPLEPHFFEIISHAMHLQGLPPVAQGFVVGLVITLAHFLFQKCCDLLSGWKNSAHEDRYGRLAEAFHDDDDKKNWVPSPSTQGLLPF